MLALIYVITDTPLHCDHCLLLYLVLYVPFHSLYHLYCSYNLVFYHPDRYYLLPRYSLEDIIPYSAVLHL